MSDKEISSKKDNALINANLINLPFQTFNFQLDLLKFANEELLELSEVYFRLFKEKLLTKTEDSLKSEDLPSNEKNDFIRLRKFQNEIDGGAKIRLHITMTSDKGKQMLYQFSNFNNRSKHAEELIREMSLVYLVSSFESFLSSILRSLIIKNIRTISPKKEINYGKIFESKNMKDLKNKLVDRELFELFYEGIEGLSEYMKSKFGFDMEKFENWSLFKEVFYRRNIIIHNSGYPNDTYKQKTGYKGAQSNKLRINKKYLVKSFELFEIYAKVIHDFFRTDAYNISLKTKIVE